MSPITIRTSIPGRVEFIQGVSIVGVHYQHLTPDNPPRVCIDCCLTAAHLRELADMMDKHLTPQPKET